MVRYFLRRESPRARLKISIQLRDREVVARGCRALSLSLCLSFARVRVRLFPHAGKISMPLAGVGQLMSQRGIFIGNNRLHESKPVHLKAQRAN